MICPPRFVWNLRDRCKPSTPPAPPLAPLGSNSTAFIRKCILAEETTALEIYWLGMLKIDLGLMIYHLLNIKIYDLSLQQNKKMHSVIDEVSLQKSKQNVRYFQNLQQSMFGIVFQRKKVITSQVTLIESSKN